MEKQFDQDHFNILLTEFLKAVELKKVYNEKHKKAGEELSSTPAQLNGQDEIREFIERRDRAMEKRSVLYEELQGAGRYVWHRKKKLADYLNSFDLKYIAIHAQCKESGTKATVKLTSWEYNRDPSIEVIVDDGKKPEPAKIPMPTDDLPF